MIDLSYIRAAHAAELPERAGSDQLQFEAAGREGAATANEPGRIPHLGGIKLM